jgi:hypothetical protein
MATDIPFGDRKLAELLTSDTETRAAILAILQPYLTTTNASSSFAPIIGSISAVFGDSLANNGEGIAYWLAALSRQIFCFPESKYIISYPGYTSASLLPLVSEITSLDPRPDYCFISAGSNDAASGVPAATFIANITQITQAFRAAGITPVLMTVPPRTGVYGLLGEYNMRLARYSAQNGFPIFDAYAPLADPATGQPLASLTADNIHPNAAGCKAVAQQAVTDLAPRFPKPIDPTTLSPSSANIIPNPSLTLDTNADGVPDGSSVTLSTGFTVSLVTDPAGFKWQRATISGATGDKTISGVNIVVPTSQTTTTLTAAASSGATSISLAQNPGVGTYKLTNATGQYEYVRILSISGSGPYTATLWTVTPLKFNHSIGDTLSPAISVGDRLGLAVRVRSAQDGGTLTWQVTAYNASSAVLSNRILTSPNSGLSRQLDGTCYNEFIVPANTATIQFSMKVSPTNGTYDYALPLIYNLTKSA